VHDFAFIEVAALIFFASLGLFLGRYSKTITSWVNSHKRIAESDVLDCVPALLWIEINGEVDWANETFRALERKLGRKLAIVSFNLAGPVEKRKNKIRAELEDNNVSEESSETLHFDITRHALKDSVLFTASSAMAAVEAEQDRARFVQTLSETFAHLPIGMAVFDKERDLSLFNPALSELLDVSALWLAKKPSLREFLDRLHDKGALPEPRNFKSWRDQIVEMEQSAESGTYFDDWHMPNDKVFRVTGRPHPKGAVAFVFEDITRPVNAEREYRMEIERLYSALDLLESGVVVFDGSGAMSFANSAFDEIWRTGFSQSLISPAVLEIAEIWNDRCEPTPILGEIKEFITCLGERANWESEIRLKTGLRLDVRINSLLGGYSMIEFLPRKCAKSTAEKLKQSA
jgi:PAS domain-containing protein